MSGAHPEERAFRWLIGGLLGGIFVSIIISGIYPLKSRVLWVTFMGGVRDGGIWLIEAIPPWLFGVGILAILGFVALGLVLMVAGWFRSLIS